MISWFNKKKKGLNVEERLELLETKIEAERVAKEEAETKLKEVTTELTLLREQHQEHEDKQNSVEPWVEIVGESIDPVRGIEIRLDWNASFIQYLKENGITAKDEDAAVQKWLAMLYQELMDKMEQQIIDNSDKKTISDYM